MQIVIIKILCPIDTNAAQNRTEPKENHIHNMKQTKQYVMYKPLDQNLTEPSLDALTATMCLCQLCISGS